MSYEGWNSFKRDQVVSRETYDKLEAFSDLLKQWNASINLVSKNSIEKLWKRHIADSMQGSALIRNVDGSILDIGTGAGFPGLIIAILGAEKVHLVESNSKKCSFLREAIRITNCNAQVHNVRLTPRSAAALNIPRVDVITARAVTSLVNLLDIVFPIVYEGTYCIFHKGSRVEDEILIAKSKWDFELDRVRNAVEPNSVILRLKNLRPRQTNGEIN